jgi:hypothetical protein
MGFERFWRGYDWLARADLAMGWIFDWRKWLWGLVPSGGGMTFLWAAIKDRSPLDVWIAATIVMAALAVFVYFLIAILEKYKKSGTAASETIADPVADIDARAAFFEILDNSTWSKHQLETTTDTPHLVRNWLDVRLDTDIHKALRNSKLLAWGQESLPGTAVTPEKPIPPDSRPTRRNQAGGVRWPYYSMG